MRIEAYAKINLTLEVLGKRADGYHALRSIVQPVSLADTLEIEETDDGVIATDTGYGEGDLIVKAAQVLMHATGMSRHLSSGVRPKGDATFLSREQGKLGLRIRVTKRIPAGGGLGGGSADAAATLRALNELWRLGRTPGQLAELGAAVGSDVPALVLAQHYRAPVLMEGRGEKVSLLRQPQPPTSTSRSLVLVNPGVHSSTPEVFRAFARSTYPTPRNDLEAPAVALYPAIGAALGALRATGARDVQMTGSGATVFGFAADDADAARIAEAMTARGYLAWCAHTLR